MIAFLKRYATVFFVATSVTYILADIYDVYVIQVIAKPMLMPLLMVFVLVSAASSKSRNLVLAALFLSFAGDVFLLFEPRNHSFFIPGLICFLITHILYIVCFLLIRPQVKGLLNTMPYLAIPCILYGILLLRLLFPALGELKIPVTVYGIVIISMLLSAIHIYNRVGKATGNFFITGAVFFIASDSLLAINKFYAPLHFPFLVMLTYCLAQYLIVWGFISHSRHSTAAELP